MLLLASVFCINTPVADMRENASCDSKVVSQAYYSEKVRVIEESLDWVKIHTLVDEYEGWIPKDVTYPISEPVEQVAKVTSVAAHLYHVNDTEYGPRLTLPFESMVEVVDKSHSRWIKVRTLDGQERFIQRGDITFDVTKALSVDEMIALSEKFLERPYTWGGRTSFGYDCSGFTQMLYRQMQVYLPRHSKEQINFKGFKAVAKEELTPGDLIFWGLDENRIRHVGLYLGDDSFIHASSRENKPYIHKSKLQDPEWDGSGKGEAGYTFCTFRSLAN